MTAKAAPVVEEKPIRLDLGCGKNKKVDFEGVDILDFGQEHKVDLADLKPWPWEDNSVTEVYASHFVEHLEPAQRIHFVNEIYRILKPGKYVDGKPTEGFATIVAPHWASIRAYGDLTHKWPPVCEMWFHYLSQAWRDVNAPHNDGYKCDFDHTSFYIINNDLVGRNNAYQIFALSNYKEAAQDIVCTLIAKK